METLQRAFKLGLQLELFTKPGEIESLVATYLRNGKQYRMLVLYDTMPDGTGYLQSKEKCETVCCSCLKEFWNQYVHALLKRRLVDGSSQNLPLLSTIKPGRNEIDKARRFWRT